MIKRIRDAIHGVIYLDKLEAEIIETLAFQRLRYIRQLSTSFLVYPSANHTRFEHSLGVNYLAQRVINRLKQIGCKMNKSDETAFRLSALLHDIGHAPFSHVAENMKLMPEGVKDHAEMGTRIIQHELSTILEQNNENLTKRINYIITGNGVPQENFDFIFMELLNGQCGIDRMDYLLRDSYFTGVSYGQYDLERILDTLQYSYSNQIYWKEGGYHALEHFILARYFMFTEVYFHKTRRILDFHLGQLMKEFLSANFPKPLYPSNVNEYLLINDVDILQFLKDSDFKDIFLNRKFFRKIDYESSTHPDYREMELWNNLEKEMNNRFDSKEFYIDYASKSPYKFEETEIRVRKNKKINSLGTQSKIVSKLKQIRKKRIYSSKEKHKEISDFIGQFLKTNGSLKY